jgi:hypothetical protein
MRNRTWEGRRGLYARVLDEKRSDSAPWPDQCLALPRIIKGPPILTPEPFTLVDSHTNKKPVGVKSNKS